MIALPKTASNHHITHQSFSVREQEVQRGTFPRWLTHQLRQEVICHTLQEPPGLFPLCCIILKGHNKVCLEPSLLQAKQTQLSQPIFVGEVLQPSDHLHGSCLDSLQQDHVLLMLGAPELDAVLQVRSHQSRVEEKNHLPQPADHVSFYAAQDTVGFLGCKCILPAHVQFFIHQYPQVLLCRAGLNPFLPQFVWILGIALTQVQVLAFSLVELHEVHMHPLLKPLKVHLNGIPSLSISTAPLSLVSSANLLRAHPIPLCMSLMKILNSIGPSMDP
ncbi:hypothetical protein QYF61_013168 [Mycteria americana]|uniref:Uncharacterized protein n=1 Tax=Mycteria americana TaxID=33587 RepID=A0AAN7SJP9_MYCAM|nr:hypothetical protein QYF61_013168 [Mycteria americana]